MYKKALYRKAYRMLNNSTPLKFDCGQLCSSKCCSGDSNAGMCLFPGEEVMLENHPDFLSLRNEKILDSEVLFAVCDGTCSRKFRPLACRIFPYVPYLDQGGRLTIIADPRARYLCPLLMESFEFKIDKRFKRNITRAFQFLLQDEEIKNHIYRLSGILDDYGKFLR